MALTYFLNRKKTTCVVTFKGSITVNDGEVLDQCLNEATAEPSQYYILNLGGLVDVEVPACRPFTLFQQGLRANSKLYICDLQADSGKILKTNGVLRESEILPDLMTCLQAILS